MGMSETYDNVLKAQLIQNLAQKNQQEPSRTKCPQNPKVEVIWTNGVCSFSGRWKCVKCIKKGDYPQK